MSHDDRDFDEERANAQATTEEQAGESADRVGAETRSAGFVASTTDHAIRRGKPPFAPRHAAGMQRHPGLSTENPGEAVLRRGFQLVNPVRLGSVRQHRAGRAALPRARRRRPR